MQGIVVSYTLRAAWKQILYWGLGLGILGVYIVFIASDSDIIQGYANLFESMPPAMLQAFGASDAELLRTAEGWIVSIFVSEAGIFLSFFAVMAGLNITTNEEQSGLMDVILSLPISRAAYLIERWIGYALIGFGIIVVCTALTLLSVVGLGVDAQVDKLFLSILNLYPGALLVMTVDLPLGYDSTSARRRHRFFNSFCGRQLHLQPHWQRRERSNCRLDGAIVIFQLLEGRRNCARYLRLVRHDRFDRSCAHRIRPFRPGCLTAEISAYRSLRDDRISVFRNLSSRPGSKWSIGEWAWLRWRCWSC